MRRYRDRASGPFLSFSFIKLWKTRFTNFRRFPSNRPSPVTCFSHPRRSRLWRHRRRSSCIAIQSSDASENSNNWRRKKTASITSRSSKTRTRPKPFGLSKTMRAERLLLCFHRITEDRRLPRPELLPRSLLRIAPVDKLPVICMDIAAASTPKIRVVSCSSPFQTQVVTAASYSSKLRKGFFVFILQCANHLSENDCCFLS